MSENNPTRPRREADPGFYRKVAGIALPLGLQSLMLALVGAADAFMLGRVQQDQMTAVSLATQIQFIQNMFLMGITTAGTILGAQYWGKGDKKTMQDIFNLMLRYAGLLSLLFFAACEFCPELLMRIYTGDDTLTAIGASYLRIAGWSYLMTGIGECFLGMMRVTDHVTQSVWISSSAVVFNVIFNLIFIFGYLGAPRLEARGAALATTLARALQLALCIFFTARPGHIRPALSRFFTGRRELTRDFFRQAIPCLGGSLFWGVGFSAYTAIVSHLGTDAAAANSVAGVVRELVGCIGNGIASAAGILVGNALGAGDLERGKAIGIRLMKLSYLIGLVSGLLVLASTPLVLRLMKLTPEAARYLTGMMIILAVYMVGRSVNAVTINGILDGGGDTIFDMYSLAVCMWGIAIPLALLGAFVFHWPVLLVYACTCLDEVGKIPWVMIRFRKYKWVRNLTR